MPKTFTSNVFSSSYKDDFVDSDNYHRILFNSGRALQARELTQLQTIIQEEIGRFGRNIFKEGGAVNPGGPTIHNDTEFVKLNVAGELDGLPADSTEIVGTTFTGNTSLVQARVLEVIPAEGADPATLFVQYVNTQNADSNVNGIRFFPDETMTNGSKQLRVAATVGTDLPVGRGCKFSSSEGDFFTRGHFVFATAQSIILSKYSRFPTATVGFKVTEDIVTSADDSALFDNQGSTPNLASPGADRYRIKLTLVNKADVADDENFVYFADVLDGDIVDAVEGTDDYNKIAEELATRTKEESGDYIVDPFTIDFSDSADNITATVSNGVAYVNGYRGDVNTPVPLILPKSRATETVNNQFTGISYGQYFIVAGATFKGLLDTRTYATINLSTHATNPSGSVIGTARVRYVEEDGSNYRVYLFDINMNSGQNIRSIRSIGTNATNRGIPVLEGSQAVLKEVRKTNMVFGLPNPRPKVLTDISYEVQRILTGTASGTQLQFTLTTFGEAFSNESQWIVVDADGDVISPTITLSGGNETATITGLANEAHTVYAKVSKGNPTVRLKNLTDATVTTTVTTGSDGVRFVNLGVTDIYEVSAVKLGSSSGADISHLFTLDDGQRAGFYGLGRMVLETGATAPTGNVYVSFKHFVHGTGDFFSVTSYNGQVDYEDIPNFKTGVRTSVNLRDVIDFRNGVNSSNAFVATSATELPTNGDTVQADVEYYLPRTDKIVVTTQGEVKEILGEAGFTSQIPETPIDTMALFTIEHNAYGLNDSDVVLTPFKAKRFTMKDISKLEDRIDKVEEATSLSLLEVDTANLMVLDENGNLRTKSGFFVDNFANRTFCDADNIEYRAAIDPSRGLLSVPTLEDDVILAYDSSKSTNTILKGDTVYLKYTESPTITQPLVSGTENVNPFAVITGEGNITMSPATDNWFQTEYTPANIINKTAVDNTEVNLGNISNGFQEMTMSQKRAFLWGGGNTYVPITGFGSTQSNVGSGWRGTPAWNWRGVVQEGSRTVNVGNDNGGRNNQDFNVIGSFSQRVVTGTKTIRKVVGERTVSLTFLPFIRSRKVFFRAEGLRPSTRFFAFFDNKSVDEFCRNEDSFKRYGDIATDAQYANSMRKSTSHPEGSANLISDGGGKIEGSFFIPSNETTRFRAGTREFKLLDISKNDDDAALSSATFNYTAQGTLDTKQKTITSTRITQVRTRRWTQTLKVKVKDPLAQSFFVTNPNGIFVTKVQTYFSTKDSTIPVQLQIRPMVNGHPSSTEIHGQSVVFNAPNQVHPPASQTQAAVEASPTTFEFEEPIFLNPETEYAIVLLAESTNYNAYVAETYAFELGSTEKRISRQPSMGSLFKSQNGTTWEPDQTKDLAFKIFTANFEASGTAVFENRDVDKELLDNNPIYMSADVGADTDAVVMLVPNHGFSIGDTVKVEGLDSATTYNGVKGTSILGARTITNADGFGIQFNADSSATSSGRFGGENILIDKQLQFDICSPNFTTMVPDDTTLVYSSKFITGKSFAGLETKYQREDNYSSDITIGDENYFSAPRLIANPSNELSNLGANERSVSIKVNMGTSRPSVSPIIDTQGASLTTESNQIDNQNNTAATGFNVPLTYSAETNAFGGSSLAKHMSVVASLDEPATGMKVILAALRPAGSELELYFRTGNDGEDILGKNWTLIAPESTQAPDAINFREYRYLIGGDSGTLDEFTEYQFKLVFKGINTSQVPFIRDFRAIAMAT